MNHYFKFIGVAICLFLTACAGGHVDPTVQRATKSYFAQSFTVTPTDAFVIGMGSFSGGAAAELSANFTAKVKSDVNSGLRNLMTGHAPANVVVQLTSIETGPSTFQSPTSVVHGVVSVMDATTGLPVLQTTFTADDSAMAARTNSNPLAALVGTAMIKAVSTTKNVVLLNLAGETARQVKVQLGGSGLF